MAKNTRIQRILALGQALIDAKRGISLERYAAQHGYSRSTVYRDADELRDIGFPIRSEGGLHRVPPHFQYFGHHGLDPDELLALFVARSLAARIPGTRFDRALDSLWTKLTAAGSQLALGPGSEGALSVAAFQSIDYEPHRDILDILDQAINERRVVHLRYRKASTGEISTRDVEPGQLHADARVEGVFLIAWCRHRKAPRVFAAQRILSATITGERFAPRPEIRSRVALRHAFGVWIGQQPDRPVPVQVRFSPAVAGEIAERRLHPSQATAPQPDGSLLLTLHLADPTCLVRWLMQYGADAQVEEPSWLAEEIAGRHAAAVAVAPGALRAVSKHKRGRGRQARGTPSDQRVASDELSLSRKSLSR